MEGNNTKDKLARALYQLMEQQRLDKIRIHEITDLAGLNRQTFYYHFQDIYDLAEWMIDTELFQGIPPMSECESWQDFLRGIFKAIGAHREVFLNIYETVPGRSLRNKIYTYIKDNVNQNLKFYVNRHNLNLQNKEELSTYITMLHFGSIIHWFDEGLPEDIEEELADYFEFLDRTIAWGVHALQHH